MLTRKDNSFKWTDDEKMAFFKLKNAFLEELVLLSIDQTKPFQIESNASKYATGAILQQKGKNNKWHPVVYSSKTFNPAKQNYQIYDKELLGIYFLRNSHSIKVLSDYKNLTYFCLLQKLNA